MLFLSLIFWLIFEFYSPGGIVPGVEEVFPLLPRDLPPVVAFRWFTLPNVDLYLEELEKTVSPREWLLMGHPVEPIAEPARYLYYKDVNREPPC